MGRLVGWLAVAVLVASVVVLVSETPAGACSCVGWTEAEAFAAADVVFTGELVEVRRPDTSGTYASNDPVRLSFAVDAVFKGEARSVQSVVTALSGASCGMGDSWPGPALVFANENGGGIRGGIVEGGLLGSVQREPAVGRRAGAGRLRRRRGAVGGVVSHRRWFRRRSRSVGQVAFVGVIGLGAVLLVWRSWIPPSRRR